MSKVDIDNLEHNAKNGFGVRLRGYIEQSSDDDVYYLYERDTNKRIAYIDFDHLSHKNVVFINDMENYRRSGGNPYTGVGKLLHEFVIYWMAQNKVEADLQMTIAHSSHAFHYKCGFRFQNAASNVEIENLLQEDLTPAEIKEKCKGLPQSMQKPKDLVKILTNKYEAPPGMEQMEDKFPKRKF